MTSQAGHASAEQAEAAEPSNSTRQRLLDAAADVFAAKGYRDARISDICRRAGANVAAVNYYFGHKDQLYAEAWRSSFEKAFEAHPIDGGVQADAAVEQRFRGYILSFLHRAMDADNQAFLIMHHEIANPTGLLDEVRNEMIRPLRERMHAIISELTDDRAEDQRIRLCATSTIGQCIHITMHRRLVPAGAEGLGEVPVETLAEHIAAFSLAGIRDACGSGADHA